MNKTAITLTAILLAAISAPTKSQDAPKPTAKLTTLSQADADWAAVKNDEKRDQINSLMSQATSSAEASLENWRWDSVHLLAYRNDGLAFWDRYPNDPRRYEWLVWNTMYNKDIFYFKDSEEGAQGLLGFYRDHKPLTAAIDEDAKAKWEARYPELKATMLASPQATEQQKCALVGYDISNRIAADDWRVASGNEVDVSSIEDDIVAYATKYPRVFKQFPALQKYFPYVPATLARTLVLTKPLPNMFLLDRASVPGFLGRLKHSPDPAVVSFSEAETQIDGLRASPLRLHFTAIDGREVDLEKLKGHVVIVEFSAVTWCSACQEMRPVLKNLYEKYHDQGLEIVTILLDPNDSKEKVAGILKQEGDLWPEWLTGSRVGNDFTKRFGVNGVPYTLFLGKDGLLAYDVAGWGPNSLATEDTLVRSLLVKAQ